ncbi:MAG: ABC transporter permease [Thermodesulfobacteriota bacterium]
MDESPAEYELSFDRPSDHTLLIRMAGPWKIGNRLPSRETVAETLEQGAEVREITFDAAEVTEWDSGLLAFLSEVNRLGEKRNIDVHLEDLPNGIHQLLKLAAAVPEKEDTGREEKPSSRLAQIGLRAQKAGSESLAFFEFVGNTFLSFLRLITGKARFRRVDFFLTLQECGPMALPIITLISVLVGLILAFVGAIQLEMFGAQIYVANLVGLAMAREMGAMMTAIIMAGRTGAAFAAQLGTMQVNEEIDALITLGISPMDFLVLPRIISLTFMMPLLCIYADLMGILGGALVGVFMLDLSPTAYYIQTQEAVPLIHFAVGIIKSGVFGVIVSVAGCMRGLECGRSATAVGQATTQAVVTAIVWIILADATLTFIFSLMDI